MIGGNKVYLTSIEAGDLESYGVQETFSGVPGDKFQYAAKMVRECCKWRSFNDYVFDTHERYG